MEPAALGFRVHSGWTAMVAISLDDGFPRVLYRDRPHLVKTFTYEFRQPYHTAEKRSLDQARDFIIRVQTEARDLAQQAIHAVRTILRKQGFEVERCGLLLASGRPLPELPQILASHALIHTADGELFREALLYASNRIGLETFTIKESDLLERAGRALHLSESELAGCLVRLGRSVGTPWSQDEKFATLVACLAMLPAEAQSA